MCVCVCVCVCFSPAHAIISMKPEACTQTHAASHTHTQTRLQDIFGDFALIYHLEPFDIVLNTTAVYNNQWVCICPQMCSVLETHAEYLVYSCLHSLSSTMLRGHFLSFGVPVFFMLYDKDYCAAVEDIICSVLVCHGVVHFISISPKSHLSVCCVTVWVFSVPLVFRVCRNLLQVILLARLNMFFMACVAAGF